MTHEEKKLLVEILESLAATAWPLYDKREDWIKLAKLRQQLLDPPGQGGPTNNPPHP